MAWTFSITRGESHVPTGGDVVQEPCQAAVEPLQPEFLPTIGSLKTIGRNKNNDYRH